jgi:hypothetical protein
MKKILTILAIAMAMGATAQGLRLNAYSSYAFDDRVNSFRSSTNFFEGVVQGGLIWGGGLEYKLEDHNYGIELSYLRMDTKAPATFFSNQPPAGVRSATFDVAINYIMLGGVRYAKINPKIEGFGGLQLGVAALSATRPSGVFIGETRTNATKFAWGLRGGINIFPKGDASKVGLKMQAGLLSAVQAAGGGLFFGTGGAGVGVTTVSSFLQFTLGGGLVYRFSK